MDLTAAVSIAMHLPIPKSYLIDIGDDGVGRCRMCDHSYVATYPGWRRTWT